MFHTDFPYVIQRNKSFGWVVQTSDGTPIQYCSTLDRAKAAVRRLEAKLLDTYEALDYHLNFIFQRNRT